MAHVTIVAIAAMTIVVGVSVIIVVLDVELCTHLCAITFFGFACGALKGLEFGYACRHTGIPARRHAPSFPP